MLITVVTLFPEMFPGPLCYSLPGKKLGTIWELNLINIRDFSDNKWKKVDDTPYGGGPGMLIKPNVIDAALQNAISFYKNTKPAIVFMSPKGKVFNNKIAESMAKLDGLIILCGRYEGIDDRVIEHWKNNYGLQEISIGDYIMFGGELPAMVIIESILRFVSGTMHNNQSIKEESFSLDLLEYPQYTKPVIWNEYSVPSVLMSGNHLEIAKWRRIQSEQITKKIRPDLWEKYKSKSTN